MCGDDEGESAGAGEEVGWGEDFIDQADAEGLCGWDDFCGDEELECGGWADESREALRAAVAGEQAEFDLWLAKTGAL